MGNRNTSIPTPGSFGNQSGGAGTWTDNQSYSMPENGWVDKVHFYSGGNGATQNFTAAVYRTDTNALLASTGTNGFNGKAWKSLTFALTSGNNNSGGYSSPYLYLWSGYGWGVGWWAGGAADTGIDTATGGFYFASGGTGPASGRVNGALNPFGNHGRLYYYLEYFVPATITALSTGPVSVGQTFTITGISYLSGVNAITVNGVNAPTFTVNSDTQITCTVPSGATTGPVVVTTNAGQATSPGNLTISGGSIARSNVWTPATAGQVARSGAWANLAGSFIARAGAWVNSQ